MQPSPLPQNEPTQIRHRDEEQVGLTSSIFRSATMQMNNSITKEYTLGGKKFTYQGPDHPYIQDLLQLAQEREEDSKYTWLKQIRQKIKSLESWFSLKCTFLGGGFEITPYHVFLWIIHWIIFIVFLVYALDLSSNSVVQKNANKQAIADNLIAFGAGFTIYNLIIIMIKQIWIVILLSLLGTLLPLWFLLNNYLNIFNFNSSTDYDFTMIFSLAFVAITVINGLFISQLYIWLKTFMKQLFASLVVNGWCLFSVFLVGYFILEYIFISETIVFQDLISYIIGKLYLPLLLILIFSWFIIKARLFDWPEEVIEKAINRLKELLIKKFIEQNPNSDRMSSWLQINQIRIIAYAIGIFYLVVEIWLFLILSSTLENNYSNSSEIMTLAFEVLVVPLYLFLGVFISITNRDLSQTFQYIPLFLGAPLIFSFLKLYFYLSSESTETANMIESIGDAIYYGPLILFVIWLTISAIGIEKRRIQMYSLGFLCFFLAFPLGVLLPLYYQNENSVILYVSYVLVGIGALILLAILGYFIKLSIQAVWRVKQITDADFVEFGEFSYYNMTPYGLWINASCFLLAIFFIGEFFWFTQEKESDYLATDVEVGTIFSLLIIHPILFYLINLALSGKSLEVKNENDYMNTSFEQLDVQLNERKLTLLKYQNYTAVLGIVLPLVILIPLSVLQSSEIFATALLGAALGLPFTFLIYKALTYIKNQSEKYENFFSSFVSSLLWCCVIFPFGVVVPILSVEFVNTSDNFQAFAQIAVASGLFICIFGVTGVSLFFSILLNKEEFERKKRFIATELIVYLKSQHVFSDMAVCSLLFMRYQYVGHRLELKMIEKYGKQSKEKKEQLKPMKEIEKQLIEDLKISYIPFGPIDYTGEDYECNKQIVSTANYNKYLNNQLIKKKTEVLEKEKKPNRCLLMCWECLQCKCGLEEQEQLNQNKQAEILTLRDLYKMDEREGLLITQLIPGFSDLYKVDDSEKIGLMAQIELEPTAKLISQKQNHVDITQINSSKTLKLKLIERKEVNSKALSKITSTDYFKSLEGDNNLFPQFMHEVFMEFSNEDEDLPPSICYNDFMQFCRITDLDIDLGNYKKYASQFWLNQTYTLNEKDFAQLLLSALPKDCADPFTTFKDLALHKIYPSLIISIKSLYSNLKETNRLLLKNKFDPNESPFCQQQIEARKNNKNDLKQQSMADQMKINLGDQTQDDEYQLSQQLKFPPKSRKQLNFEYAKRVDEIEKKYDEFWPWYKKCCYSILNCFNLLCCQYTRDCWNTIILGFKEDKKKPVKKGWATPTENQFRMQMNDWKKVAEGAVKCLLTTINVYEQQQQQKLSVKEFRKTVSNVIAVSSRLSDIYGLAALAYNSNIGWFSNDSSSFDASSTVSGEAFYKSYAFYFYCSLAVSFLYGILGRVALFHVKENTFGQNTTTGAPAWFPHPQFFLTQSIKLLNMVFLIVMKTFIDAFVCDYDTGDDTHYYLVRDSSIECLSDQHYIYMGLALLGVSIYYPLTTYLQPIFQFNDHSLDLKYKSTYLVVYVQCKLLILGLSSLFANFNSSSLLFQLIFAAVIMLFVVIFYLRMRPCLIEWFNMIELFLFLIVLSVYIGGIIILFTEDYLIGLIFTISAASLLILILIGYFVKTLLYSRQREKIGISDPQKKIITNSSQVNWVPTKPEDQQKIKTFKGKKNKDNDDPDQVIKQKQESKQLQILKPIFQESVSEVYEGEYIPMKKIEGQINKEADIKKNVKMHEIH